MKKILADFLFQFLKSGVYESGSADESSPIDLVNLTICKWENNKYFATEWMSFESVALFIAQNLLYDIYLQFFSNSLAELPPSAQGFIMEKSFLVLLHLLKDQSLISFVPGELRSKLSTEELNWVTNAKIVSYPVRNLTSRNNASNLESLNTTLGSPHKYILAFANVSAPVFLYSGPVDNDTSYWFALGMKYSSNEISTADRKRNERVVQLENLFYSANEEAKHPTEKHEDYLRKVASVGKQIAALQTQIANSAENTNALETKLKQLSRTHDLLENVSNAIERHKYQFRLRVELATRDHTCSQVDTSLDGRIIDVRLNAKDYLQLWRMFPDVSKKLQAYLKECFELPH